MCTVDSKNLAKLAPSSEFYIVILFLNPGKLVLFRYYGT